MSELLVLGVSHKTAPLDLRERLSLTEGRAASLLAELVAREDIGEAAAISTCNRTELYVLAADSVGAESATLSALASKAEIQPTALAGHLYSLRGPDVARHLFEVTAGLDSMIVGEAEIQGQVKRAFELALVEGVTGPVLNRMFRGALAGGKRARAETGISRRAMSVPTVAVELAQRTLGDLSSRTVLLVGAGETAELTARALSARGVEPAFVANRHHDRAIGLAARYGGRAVRLEELPELMREADIVVTSTNSPHHIIESEGLEAVMADRSDPPLLLIDLAVPRDVDPECRELSGVTVHDMDDLQTLVERNLSGRESEARAASRILAAELERFERWLASQDAVSTLRALRRRASDVVDQVLAENEARWESLSEADRERLALMARAIASRLLHEPTMRIRRAADDDEAAYLYVNALRELFGLDSESEPLEEGAGAEVRRIGDRRGRGA